MESCQSLFVTSIKGGRLLKPMWKIVPLVQLVLDTLKGGGKVLLFGNRGVQIMPNTLRQKIWDEIQS